MKKYNIKISYNQRSDKNGCIYKKTFTINKKIFDNFMLSLEVERAMKIDYDVKDYYRDLYLKTPISNLGDVYFLNLTQAQYFLSYLKRMKNNKQLNYNEKRADYTANTCLIVN